MAKNTSDKARKSPAECAAQRSRTARNKSRAALRRSLRAADPKRQQAWPVIGGRAIQPRKVARLLRSPARQAEKAKRAAEAKAAAKKAARAYPTPNA